MNKIALITGISGQDGHYLSNFLIDKGYEVHGIKRNQSSEDAESSNICYHYSDLSDPANLTKIISEIQPDEIYNLAAQSNVKTSFERPEYTSSVNALGPLRLLEAIRVLGMEKTTKFLQASTSELYGKVQEMPQSETTPFNPRSPYAVSKIYAHWITINYRESYDIFACNAILFNHESPLRGQNFVTRKITNAAVRINYGLQDKLYLGNLDAKRDWGFAGDYVEAMWLMLQQDETDDFVVSTGMSHSVREFVELAFKEVDIDIVWEGHGIKEVGMDNSTKKVLVEINPDFYRPVESTIFLGDSSKLKKKAGWKPKVGFEELVEMMVKNDIELVKSNI